jgi:hypothetical protein
MFTVVDKHYNSLMNDYWYRIDVQDHKLIHWIVKQPQRLWYHIEHSNHGVSYTINEELYTVLQLTWGDQ